MNFSGMSDKSIMGKVVRLPLRLIPPKTVMPILQGKLKGLKWIAGSSNHGCWLGSYEHAKQKTFEKAVTMGSVVYDIGANAGFYTLLASVLVGPKGRVFAFEPVPLNLHHLNEHLRINRITNVTVIDAAVAGRAGVAHFDEGPNHSMGHLAFGGSLTVRTVCLDEMVKSGELPPPDFMKIDVEGAEVDVLQGAKSVLENHHPVIFLATHSEGLHRTCSELLLSHGYSFECLDRPDEVLAAYAQARSAGEIPDC